MPTRMTAARSTDTVPSVTTPVILSMGTGHVDVRGACPRPGVVASLTALVTGAVAVGWLAPLAAYDPLTYVAAVAVAMAVSSTGVVLALDDQQSGTGRLLIAVAVVWLFSWSNEWRVGPLPLLSGIVGPLWYVLGALALLRYPHSRLERRYEQLFLVVLGVWACGGASALAALSRPEWSGFPPDAVWPAVVADPDRGTYEALATGWFAGLGACFALLLVLLGAKVRRSRGLDRREILPPACAAGGIAVAGLAYVGVRLVDVPAAVRDLSLLVVAVAVASTPIAFLVVAVRWQAARAAVAALVVELTTRTPGSAAVSEALRTALRDPGLRLSYWNPSEGRFEEVDEPPALVPDDGWRVELRDADGEPLAALVLDPLLRRHPELVTAAVGAGALALANGRLHHRLRAQLAEVQASRQRIVTATREERQRLERAVHDGAQGPLVAVTAALSTVRLQVRDRPDVLAAVERAQDTVRTALGDLRDIARGIHPMVLSEEGLRAALARLAEGLRVPTTIDIPDTRLPRDVESALYYTAAEALTNVVRHAEATHVHVVVGVERDAARMAVTDDGRGGAAPEGGSGLLGLRDRARALGGDLAVADGPTGGTCLVVTIPCG